jgi:hypothetical protein
MDRGLRARLSPNEESTLRQLSLSAVDQMRLQPTNVEQLAALQLIEALNGVWRLTATGALRAKGLLVDKP